MQKLSVKFKNTPGNASQVPCSVNEVLNREDTLGVSRKVLADNISDENLHSGKSGQNMRVFVLNMRGEPLMPTTPRKTRELLEQGKAKVIQRTPFTIQLLYASGESKHDRIKIGLEKSHANDAFVIAGGDTQHRCKTYAITLKRRNNRSIQTNRNGFKPSIRRQRYILQPNDLVKHEGLLCRVKGVFNYGKWVRLVDSAGTIINSNIKKVELLTYGKGLQFT